MPAGLEKRGIVRQFKKKWLREDVGGAHPPQRRARSSVNGLWRWPPWTGRFLSATLWPPRVRRSRPHGTSPRQSKRQELADDRRGFFVIYNPVCTQPVTTRRDSRWRSLKILALHLFVCLMADGIEEVTLWGSVGGAAVHPKDDLQDLLTL